MKMVRNKDMNDYPHYSREKKLPDTLYAQEKEKSVKVIFKKKPKGILR